MEGIGKVRGSGKYSSKNKSVFGCTAKAEVGSKITLSGRTLSRGLRSAARVSYLSSSDVIIYPLVSLQASTCSCNLASLTGYIGRILQLAL